MAGFMDFLRGNNGALLQTGLGLIGGRTGQEQAAMGAQGLAGALEQNRTMQYLQKVNPQLAAEVKAGRPIGSAWEEIMAQRTQQAKKPRNFAFQTLADGTYGTFDAETGVFAPMGKAEKAGGMDDYSNRANAAKSLGLSADDPRYPSFVLTGKMPREDMQSLTATDKKAILEADDSISTNQSAIGMLDQAIAINDKANSGYTAGSRAWLGNNLPDVVVPDAISSPESSAATVEYDNLVQQGALSQLKTIFGGNPTEGERAILLELQASSNKPPPVRKKILERAKALAEKRLELNQTRANQLRGGDFYKPQGGMSGSPHPPSGNATSSGVKWSIEP